VISGVVRSTLSLHLSTPGSASALPYGSAAASAAGSLHSVLIANQALAALRSHQALKADRNEHTNAGPIVQIRSNPQVGTAATSVE